MIKSKAYGKKIFPFETFLMLVVKEYLGRCFQFLHI